MEHLTMPETSLEMSLSSFSSHGIFSTATARFWYFSHINYVIRSFHKKTWQVLSHWMQQPNDLPNWCPCLSYLLISSCQRGSWPFWWRIFLQDWGDGALAPSHSCWGEVCQECNPEGKRWLFEVEIDRTQRRRKCYTRKLTCNTVLVSSN